MTMPGQHLIYAHRGTNREAAENTRPAFDRALEYAIDGIETDVQLSRDEVAVLWHDRFLDKLGLPGKRIDEFDLAQLRAMDFAAHFAPGGKPESIVTLAEFLTAYRKRCRLLIEIKHGEREPAARREIKVRQTLDMIGPARDGSVIVSSFDLASLVYAHQCRPDLPLVYNLDDDQTLAGTENVLIAQPFLHGMCLPVATLDEAMVKLLRSHGKSIAVYTCNSDEEIGRALRLGVDILISDVPEAALAIRDK